MYLLECADGTLYTGWTTDPDRRLREHNAGRASRYTRGRRPVRIVYLEPQPDRTAARRREAALRRLTRRQKRALIRAAADGPASSPRGESHDRADTDR